MKQVSELKKNENFDHDMTYNSSNKKLPNTEHRTHKQPDIQPTATKVRQRLNMDSLCNLLNSYFSVWSCHTVFFF